MPRRRVPICTLLGVVNVRSKNALSLNGVIPQKQRTSGERKFLQTYSAIACRKFRRRIHLEIDAIEWILEYRVKTCLVLIELIMTWEGNLAFGFSVLDRTRSARRQR